MQRKSDTRSGNDSDPIFKVVVVGLLLIVLFDLSTGWVRVVDTVGEMVCRSTCTDLGFPESAFDVNRHVCDCAHTKGELE
jgi:hypothetical protein